MTKISFKFRDKAYSFMPERRRIEEKNLQAVRN